MVSFPLITVMTDSLRLAKPQDIVQHLPVGSVIVFRHYDAPDRLQLGQTLRRLTRRRGQILLVAGADWQLAERLGADGLHLPEGLARHGVLAPLLSWCRNRGRILSVAAHTPLALSRAAALGADWAILSPIFSTASHPNARPLGPLKMRLLVQRADLPLVALGGVNEHTVRQLRHSGLAGVAFGSAMKSCCLRAIKRGTL